MIQWTPFCFVRIVVCFAAGILCWHSLQSFIPGFCAADSPVNTVVYLLTALLAVVLAIYLILLRFANGEQKRRFSFLFGLSALSAVALSGALLTWQRTEFYDPTHFLHLAAPVLNYRAVITSENQVKEKVCRLEVEMTHCLTERQWQPVTGKIMLSVVKDSLSARLRCGDVLLISGTPFPVSPPQNPGDFDYRAYLSNQQIYHQQYVPAGKFVVAGYESPGAIKAASLTARQWCNELMQRFIPSPEAAGIAAALLTGTKQGLTPELKQVYMNTGTMHILAVSGMHVVLLFGSFSWLAGGLQKTRRGSFVFVALALSGLWFFAFITGLSASVLRAVCMFSFVVVAPLLGRQNSPFNTLGVSAFVLLCADPYMLLDAGFLLSYAAVIGIFLFHRKIYQSVRIPYRYIKPQQRRLWKARLRQLPFRLLDGGWNLVCLSLAAQLTTLPLVLLFFHQFPVYFLPANLIAVPLSELVLYLDILMLLFSWWKGALHFIGWMIHGLVYAMNLCIKMIEGLPCAAIEGVHLSGAEMVLLYVVLILIGLLFYFRRMVYLRYAVATAFVFSVLQWREYGQQAQQQQLVFYHTRQGSAIQWIDGHQSFLFAEGLSDFENQSVVNYSGQCGVIKTIPVQQGLAYSKNPDYDFFICNGKRITVLRRKTAVVPETDFLVLSQNAIRKIEHIRHFRFKQLVIDGSNKKYLAQRLKSQADSLKINCHAVALQGAYLIRN